MSERRVSDLETYRLSTVDFGGQVMTAIIVTIGWLLGIAFFWALVHGGNR
jgi:hypothetical protein